MNLEGLCKRLLIMFVKVGNGSEFGFELRGAEP